MQVKGISVWAGSVCGGGGGASRGGGISSRGNDSLSLPSYQSCQSEKVFQLGLEVFFLAPRYYLSNVERYDDDYQMWLSLGVDVSTAMPPPPTSRNVGIALPPSGL